jgi:DNA-binding transcriptional LysR family regulator
LKKRAGFLFCRAGHPLLEKVSPKLSDLADYPLIFGTVPPSTARLDAGGRFAHLDPVTGGLVPQVECYSIGVAKQIVAASDGIGAASFSMLSREIRDRELVPIALTIPGLETNYCIITLRGRTPTPAAQAFVNITRALDDAIDELRLPLRARKSKPSRRLVSTT